MATLKGAGGSEGYANGPAILRRSPGAVPVRHAIGDAKKEAARFREAQRICTARVKVAEQIPGLPKEAQDVLLFYRLVLRDDWFYNEVLQRVAAENLNIEYALWEAFEQLAEQIEQSPTAYMRGRGADMRHVCRELVGVMQQLSYKDSPKAQIITDGILVAQDISPAELMRLDRAHIRGIVTETGSASSHTAILAMALGIPLVAGVGGALAQIQDGEELLLDALSLTVIVRPTQQQKDEIMLRYQQESPAAEPDSSPRQATQTRDGFPVQVTIAANVLGDGKNVKCRAADGIGLLRTELLYMQRDALPDEQELYLVYRQIVRDAKGKPVVIRTLDLGGDKRTDLLPQLQEPNPLLGCRGIRVCLRLPEIFHTQLRAILRASVDGDVRILLPFICTVEELLLAKTHLLRAKTSLAREGIAFRTDIPLGAMIETPAAALLCDALAAESDFLSVGLNDLIQYIAVADRNNPNVSNAFDCYNLSVLRAVRMVAEAATAAGIPWSICGESAARQELLPLWVALGAHGVCVPAAQVAKTRRLIHACHRAELYKECAPLFLMAHAEDAKSLLHNILTVLKPLCT